MTPQAWLTLAGGVAVLLLPAPLVARTTGLTSAGRLLRPSRASRLVPVRVVSTRAVMTAIVGLLVSVLWFGGLALAVAASAVTGTIALLVRDSLRARRESRSERSLLAAVRLLAAELTAGATPAVALAAAAEFDADARSLLGAAAAGDAAVVLADSPEPVVRRLAVAWRLGVTGGAALAEVVERVASDLADRAASRRAVEVAVAGPRSSAALLSGLPLLGVALGAGMGARPLDFLLGDAAGRLLCCIGVLLDVAGMLWLRRMIGRVQP